MLHKQRLCALHERESARARAEAERQRASERFAVLALALALCSGAAFGDFASCVSCVLLRTFAVASWQRGTGRECVRLGDSDKT